MVSGFKRVQRVQKVQKVQKVHRGRLTGLRPEGCGRLTAAGYIRFAQGATAPAALRVADCRRAAMLIKSALRNWLYESYSMKSILLTGSLRSPPLWWLRHHLSPASGGTTTRAKLRVTYEKIASRSFILPPLAGEVPRSGQGGMHFQRPPGRLYGFRRQRRHKKWRPKGRRTSPAQRYYITPEGESPQPVREASAGPGQNPWRPGPKARRRHQPSRRSRVNLREYRQAPPKSQS